MVVRSAERLVVQACELAAAGILGCEGGWFDQPATFVDAIMFLLRYRDRRDAEEKRRRKELTGG